MTLFITELFTNPLSYLICIAVVIASVCFHEFCHASVAHILGDTTASENGFMTLNPFKVMGPGALIMLFLFGITWGSVPVKSEDPSRLRRSAISLAGPLANLLLLCIFSLILTKIFADNPNPVSEQGSALYYISLIVLYGVSANAMLFLFNILPVPGLDGWHVLEPFMPSSLVPTPENKAKCIRIFFFLICFSGASGYFDKAMDKFTQQFMPQQIANYDLIQAGDACMEKEDYAGAFQAYSAAAEQGNVAGKLNLGLCYAEGIGCQMDPQKAFALFSQEDVCQLPLAKAYIGIMFLMGEGGCPQDYSTAFRILSEPEVQEAYPVVKIYYASMLAYGTAGKEDADAAFKILNAPDVQDFPLTKFLLGSIYYEGRGTKQDFGKAAMYLQQAAEAGQPDAVQFLGYQDGKMPDYGMSLEELLQKMWEDNKK